MITSTSNARVRLLRSLVDRRSRQDAGLFLVEGVRLAEEVVDAGIHPHVVLFNEAMRRTERGSALLADLEPVSDWLEAATAPVLASVSAVQHEQGIALAVPLALPALPPRRQRPHALHDILVVLDDLADPGNAGAILRTARSAGVRRVLISAGSVDVFGPKVVRAAGGAHFHLHLTGEFRWSNAATVLPSSVPVLLADAHAGEPYWRFDWSGPVVIVVGGEAHGAGFAAKRSITHRVRIPMPGGGDSLNVAMATSIMLFEAVRQRSTGAVAP